MLIEAKILFTDEKQSDLLGKDVEYEDSFTFNLKKVSGLMPGDDEGKRTIIFLDGKDILIKKPFSELLDLWKGLNK